MLVAATACSSSEDDTVPADAQRVTVTVGDTLAFDSATLTVRSATPVAVTVKNTGNTDHDFMIVGMPATGIRNKSAGGHGRHDQPGTVVGHPKKGGEVTILFTPTQPGTYEYYCSVTGHKDAGMKGTITVT